MEEKQLMREVKELFAGEGIRSYLDRIIQEDQVEVGLIVMATVNMLDAAYDPRFPENMAPRTPDRKGKKDYLEALEMAKRVRNMFPERPTLLEYFQAQKRIDDILRAEDE